MTRQYGVFDQALTDLQNTRMFGHFLNLLQVKIDCLKSLGVNNCTQTAVNYRHFLMHDINLITIMSMFDLEQHFDMMQYASTFIIELHYDEGCLELEDCLSVKIFFNDLELFTELSYCDYQTGKCSYKKFRQALRNRMILDEDEDIENLCLVSFTSKILEMHYVQIA